MAQNDEIERLRAELARLRGLPRLAELDKQITDTAAFLDRMTGLFERELAKTKGVVCFSQETAQQAADGCRAMAAKLRGET